MAEMTQEQKEKEQKIIEGEVVEIVTAEQKLSSDLAVLENELQADPKFQAFLEKQSELRTAQAQSNAIWEKIEARMIELELKTIKGDFGSIGITNRTNWDIDLEQLPAKFIKKVPDTTKIGATFKLEGKAPKGCTPRYSKYLTKRLK